ncbi:DNA-binding protein [Mycobacterium haemophilum DSM 44634]|uniref:hypothetical protein n=1 Tax=Mycobacterium haemophilum TaxID=29311 RepID=UPI0006D5CAFD|nr:hypothetical protein [Mycobacterium haemophilum]
MEQGFDEREAFGGGTVAYDPGSQQVQPHIHVAIGLKEHSASGHSGHSLGAKVQFLTEMLVLEVVAPMMRRRPDAEVYDVPLLRFDTV